MSFFANLKQLTTIQELTLDVKYFYMSNSRNNEIIDITGLKALAALAKAKHITIDL
jgi:hypothetical protein